MAFENCNENVIEYTHIDDVFAEVTRDVDVTPATTKIDNGSTTNTYRDLIANLYSDARNKVANDAKPRVALTAKELEDLKYNETGEPVEKFKDVDVNDENIYDWISEKYHVHSIDACKVSSGPADELRTIMFPHCSEWRKFYKNKFNFITQPNIPADFVDEKGNPVKNAGKKPVWRVSKQKEPVDKNGNVKFTKLFHSAVCDVREGENISLITGKVSGVFAIDIDLDKDRSDGDKLYSIRAFSELAMKYTVGVMSSMTLTARSGSGGIHFFFKYTDKLKKAFPHTNAKSLVDDDGEKLSIDIRTDGGNITLPPSMHSCGGQYKFVHNGVYEIKEMPDALLAALVRYRENAKGKFEVKTLDGNGNEVYKSDKVSVCNMSELMHIPTNEELGNNDIIEEIIKPVDDFPYAKKSDRVWEVPNSSKIFSLISRLNKDRFAEYDNWYKLILILRWCGHRIGDEYNYLDFAIDFSKRCGNWKEGDEAHIKATFHQPLRETECITIGTLYYWLMEDNKHKDYSTYLPMSNIVEHERVENTVSFAEHYSSFHRLNLCDEGVRDRLYSFFRSNISFIAGYEGCGSWLTLNYKEDIESGLRLRKFVDNSIGDMRTKLSMVKLYKDVEKFDRSGNARTERVYIPMYKLLEKYFGFIKFQYIDFYPYSVKTPNYKAKLASIKRDSMMNLYSSMVFDYCENYVVDEQIIEPIINHVKLLCGDAQYDEDGTIFNYVIRWLAWTVQRPDCKTEKCLIFQSEQGTGKSMFFNWFCKYILSGDYTYKTENLGHVIDKFNSDTAFKLLVVLEELSNITGREDVNSVLKNLITRADGNYEKKYMNAVNLKDYCNYVMLTNNNSTVVIEESDRRYVCIKVSEKMRGLNKEYYTPLSLVMRDNEVARAFYHYLMNLDLTEFNLRDSPVTEMKKEMKAKCADPIYHCLVGEIESDDLNKNGHHFISYKKGNNIEFKPVYVECTYDKNDDYSIDDYWYIGTPDELYFEYRDRFKGEYGDDFATKTEFVSKLKGVGFEIREKCPTSIGKIKYGGKRVKVLMVNRAILYKSLNNKCNTNLSNDNTLTYAWVSKDKTLDKIKIMGFANRDYGNDGELDE